MSNEKDLNIDQLQEATADTATKATKVKKEVTAEDVANLEAATAKIIEFGVSEKFAKVLPLVAVWHDKDLAAPVKEAVIAEFGGSEEFKTYIGTEFEAELAVISGIAKSASVLNNVKAFYKRRNEGGEKVSRKKAKMMQITIGGKPHSINQEYYESLAGTPTDEKRALILAHADTKEVESVEIL